MIDSMTARLALSVSALTLAACAASEDDQARIFEPTADAVMAETPGTEPGADEGTIHPDRWPAVRTPPLDPVVEARVDEILAELTLEQKVGQVIQADSASVTPEEVKQYRLGSVLSGGNSAPGPLPYASTEEWLEAADAYFDASLDPEGVEVPVPIIWGIDAVHGHGNLKGAVVFPHNIGLGAARDPDLIERIMEVTARELSVSGHDWTFAPTLAVPRDDRWGRTYEGFSEDPEIVADYAPRVVYGLQGKVGEPGFMSEGHVIPSAKHFVGDGGTQNGVDQGDARITEAELRDVHAAGYVTALEAGVQTVMASFSSWQGQRMHGSEALMTDVLKGRMSFRGFIVGDWNGHGLIPGCTNTDCPAALNAGLDMYMAPDSWKGLWESTLRHVQDGTIPMERLDDAVRRILRVKVASGVMDEARPSERPLAGQTALLGSAEHRAVAREAVRKSMVLLKNEGGVLPLSAGANVLVTGDGADSISKAAGGWTLSWQGGGFENEEFPNGQTVLTGIEEAVRAGGGTVAYAPSPSEEAVRNADAIIAVYGEDPYAEFQGDKDDADFVPTGFDTDQLAGFRATGTPVVSVFISGRPLYANPEINASDAFVAAFLPGSEGGGVADLLFRTDPRFDFTGRLSFSWPKRVSQSVLNVGEAGYDPLFALGYGLSFGDESQVAALEEDDSADASGPRGVYFTKGQAQAPWEVTDDGSPTGPLPYRGDGLTVAATDMAAQEDALRIGFTDPDAVFALASGYARDVTREANGAMELTFQARRYEGADTVRFGMACETDTAEACAASLSVEVTDDWRPVRLALSCFADRGVSMTSIDRILTVSGAAGQEIGLADVRLMPDDDGSADCAG